MLFFSKRDESVLYGYFHEFHDELLGIREQLLRQDWAIVGAEDFPDNVPFRRDLLDLFNRQERDAAGRAGEHGIELYRELKYILVAFIDEYFLHLLDWEGKELWRKHLLEQRLFNSHASGQVFFEKADHLIAERDPVTVELARIYLLILSLGFEGMYRERDDKGDLTRYRRSLYYLVTRREPTEVDERLLNDKEMRIFPAAYEPTLAEGLSQPMRRWLPAVSRWYLGFVLLLGAGLIVSVFLWHRLSDDLLTATDRILGDSWGSTYAKSVPERSTSQVSLADLQRERGKRERAERDAEIERKRAEELRARLKALEAQKAPEVKAEEPPPLAPPPETVERTFTLGDYSFRSGRADLGPEAVGQLDELAAYMNRYEDATALIKGYTDDVGNAERNLKLSLSRARAVSAALEERGIAPERLTASGYGESFSVAPNETEAGRRKNRRVVVVVTHTEPVPQAEALPGNESD